MSEKSSTSAETTERQNLQGPLSEDEQKYVDRVERDLAWNPDDKLQKFVVRKVRDEFISGEKTTIKVDDRNSIAVPRATYMSPKELEDYHSRDRVNR